MIAFQSGIQVFQSTRPSDRGLYLKLTSLWFNPRLFASSEIESRIAIPRPVKLTVSYRLEIFIGIRMNVAVWCLFISRNCSGEWWRSWTLDGTCSKMTTWGDKITWLPTESSNSQFQQILLVNPRLSHGKSWVKISNPNRPEIGSTSFEKQPFLNLYSISDWISYWEQLAFENTDLRLP